MESNKEETVLINFRVPKTFKDYISEKAKEKGVSLTDYVCKRVAPEYFQKELNKIIHP